MISASIIIPTFNGLDRLQATLDALRRQTCNPRTFEVIVVVDGSTDSTTSLLADLRAPFDFSYFSRTKHGRPQSRNFAADRARGRLLVFLDDDIVAEPELVEEHLLAHGESTNIVALGKMTQDCRDSLDWYGRCFSELWNQRYIKLEDREPGWSDLWGGNFSVTREVFRRVGGFTTDLISGEDVELGRRLQKAGMRFVYAPRAAGTHVDQKSMQELILRSRRSGMARIDVVPKHSEVLADLAMIYRELETSKRVMLRILMALRIPALYLPRIRYLMPSPKLRMRLHKIVQHYSHWCGVKDAIELHWQDGWRSFSRGVPILMYHAFTKNEAETGRFVISGESFARQMNWLHENRYRVLSVSDLAAIRRKGVLPNEKCVVLTIDDGYLDFLTVAEPILRQYGFNATIYLVTRRTGDDDTRDGRGELNGRRTLTWDDVQKLKARGFDIGAHTMTHAVLPELTGQEANREISGSRDDLRKHLLPEACTFAYPYGEYDSEIRMLVSQSGFSAACTVDDGLNHPALDDFLLRRTEIRGGDSLLRFRLKVASGLNLNRLSRRSLGRFFE
jgi:peptidoglycan/xylan/chitin deacetylase (PgdA/CDA1 family)/GT2 family glycosyltransferase